MFILDTNVVSELRRPDKASKPLLAWASSTAIEGMFLSVITILELELGILRVERRDAVQGIVLRSWLETQILPRFGQRLLAIDLVVARRCASLHVPDPQSERDALIAATALSHGMTVVTRNTDDFAPTGASIFNPWQATA